MPAALVQRTCHLLTFLCSPDGTCPCPCNYASAAGCICRDLAQTVNVQLAKSPVYSTYPLTYAQAFNFHPTEVRHGSARHTTWSHCQVTPSFSNMSTVQHVL